MYCHYNAAGDRGCRYLDISRRPYRERCPHPSSTVQRRYDVWMHRWEMDELHTEISDITSMNPLDTPNRQADSRLGSPSELGSCSALLSDQMLCSINLSCNAGPTCILASSGWPGKRRLRGCITRKKGNTQLLALHHPFPRMEWYGRMDDTSFSTARIISSHPSPSDSLHFLCLLLQTIKTMNRYINRCSTPYSIH